MVGTGVEIAEHLPVTEGEPGQPRGQPDRIHRRGSAGTGMHIGQRLRAATDVPVGVVGLFQRLQHRGQRLPGNVRRLGRLSTVDQPVDHREHLVDLGGVCPGVRVLDGPVPREAADVEQFTNPSPDIAQVRPSSSSP